MQIICVSLHAKMHPNQFTEPIEFKFTEKQASCLLIDLFIVQCDWIFCDCAWILYRDMCTNQRKEDGS